MDNNVFGPAPSLGANNRKSLHSLRLAQQKIEDDERKFGRNAELLRTLLPRRPHNLFAFEIYNLHACLLLESLEKLHSLHAGSQCTEDDLIGIVDGCADLGEGGGGGRHCEDRRGKIKDGRIINVSASVLHLTSSISSVHSLPKPTVRHHDRYHRLDHRDHTGNDARIVTTFLRYLTDGRSWLDADIQNQVFSS